MAERLTKHNETGWVLKLDNPQNDFEARQQLMSKFKFACEKLGKIEDLLEKYGIESVELLEHIIKKGIVINSTIEDFAKEEYDKMKQDRDTWQRACELACKRICYMLDQEMQYHEHEKFNSEEYLKTEIDYFYQQAKTEGNNE